MPENCEYCEGLCECPKLVKIQRESPPEPSETVDEKLRRATAEAVRAYIHVMGDTASVPPCAMAGRAIVA